MKITVDTNVLLRAALADDKKQSAKAQDLLRTAELVVVPIVALCEFVWVMRQGLKIAPQTIAKSLRQLAAARNVVMDVPVFEAGIAILEAGGDFADAALAKDGQARGGEIFVSFDSKAVRGLAALGFKTKKLT